MTLDRLLNSIVEAIVNRDALVILVEAPVYDPLLQRLETADTSGRFLGGEVPRLCGIPLVRYPLIGSWSVRAGGDGYPRLEKLPD